jgi:hypothetical protein
MVDITNKAQRRNCCYLAQIATLSRQKADANAAVATAAVEEKQQIQRITVMRQKSLEAIKASCCSPGPSSCSCTVVL